jgi:hypothetical protein
VCHQVVTVCFSGHTHMYFNIVGELRGKKGRVGVPRYCRYMQRLRQWFTVTSVVVKFDMKKVVRSSIWT